MQQNHRWTVVLLVIATLLLAACSSSSTSASKSEPAKVEHIPNTDLSRVVLTTKAAERLDIRTATVREEQVERKRRVGGQVEAAGDGVLVRVPLNESDLNKVDQGLPALVLPLARDDQAAGWPAQAVEAPVVDDPSLAGGTLYYALDSADHGLVPGQLVLVEVSLLGSGEQRLVVPYTTVIYDLHGETWLYTKPESLTYVRHAILVDYIEGDTAVLLEGPPIGTEVVTTGVAELFGTEFGVGK